MAACSSTPDTAAPVESSYGTGNAGAGGSTTTASSADSSSSFPQPERPAGTASPPTAAPAESGGVPGGDQPYPNLATVPERPQTRTAAQRAELEAGLVADRTQRRYSDEVISLQGSSDTVVASAPPPPPDLPPSPNESPSPPAAAAITSAAAEIAPPPGETSAPPPPPATPYTSAESGSTAAPPPPPATPYTSAESGSTAAPPPPPAPYASAESGSTAASSMPGGGVDAPSPPPATESEAYLPPPPSRDAAAAAAEAEAPAAYTPPSAQPAPTYSSAPSQGGPVPVTGPGAAASAAPAAAASAPGAASSSATTGVESVYQAMLREQSQPVSTLPPVERPVPPPVYTAPAPVAGAQGRNVGRGPGGERLVSYQPTTMTPASAAPGLPMGLAQQAATIQFSSGSSGLDARDRTVLRDVAQLWRERGGRLYVVGHSSSTGSGNPLEAAEINERISQRRANSVASALAQYGVPRSALVVSAVGASRPQYAEVRVTGVAGNQRVEIYFVN